MLLRWWEMAQVAPGDEPSWRIRFTVQLKEPLFSELIRLLWSLIFVYLCLTLLWRVGSFIRLPKMPLKGTHAPELLGHLFLWLDDPSFLFLSPCWWACFLFSLRTTGWSLPFLPAKSQKRWSSLLSLFNLLRLVSSAHPGCLLRSPEARCLFSWDGQSPVLFNWKRQI